MTKIILELDWPKDKNKLSSILKTLDDDNKHIQSIVHKKSDSNRGVMKNKGLLNSEEAAKYLGVSTNTLAAWRTRALRNVGYWEYIRWFKENGRIYYRKADLKDFLKEYKKDKK